MVAQILQGFAYTGPIVAKAGNSTVARFAKHPAHFARSVTVIYADTGLLFADMAFAVLLGLQCFYLGYGDAVSRPEVLNPLSQPFAVHCLRTY
jgi:hypothetical protein